MLGTVLGEASRKCLPSLLCSLRKHIFNGHLLGAEGSGRICWPLPLLSQHFWGRRAGVGQSGHPRGVATAGVLGSRPGVAGCAAGSRLRLGAIKEASPRRVVWAETERLEAHESRRLEGWPASACVQLLQLSHFHVFAPQMPSVAVPIAGWFLN